MNKVEARINHNYYKQIADKITQLLDKIHDSQLSDKRWVWELMQNAKDVPNKFGRVSVLIELWEDKLIFSHNGDYFTDGNITGLIQQVSSKDSANEGELKQTGKFGTGFITTHLLSNIIDVKGVVKNPNTGEYQNFKLTLDRSARKSEDMIESIAQNLEWVKGLDNGNYQDFPIANNYESRSENEYLTSFTYYLNEDSLKSATIGLSDLINTLPITMVSLRELKSVRVVNHVEGTEQLYECNSETIYRNDNVKIIRSAIDINGDKKYYLTYKTFKGEDPVVALSIETLWDGSTYSLIKRDKSQPVLFRDFPLIGSEEFHFPYMLNGFDFEPTETRSGVLLNSNQPKPQKNRSIIENAVKAVINFNDWLITSGAKNTYLLASSKEPKPKEAWDETYAKPWIKKLQENWRGKLLSQTILETKEGYASLREIRIPDYGTKEANRQFFYFLEGFITEGILPLAEQQDEWSEVVNSNYSTWNCTLKYSKLDFFEDLQRIGCMKNLCSRLNKSENECYEWLNRLFKFVVDQNDTSILEKFPVIPNQSGDFCLLDKVCTDSAQRIPDKLKNICVGLLGKNLKDELMAEAIDDSVFTTKKEYTLETLVSDINRIIGSKASNENFVSSLEWNVVSPAVYSLLSLKTNGTEEENNKRDYVYQFISHFVASIESQTIIEDLPIELWKEAERFVIKFTPSLIVANSTSIASLGNNLLKYPTVHNVEECINWLNDYGLLAKSFSMTIPPSKKIYPNQNGTLESLSTLHFDNFIPEKLKDLNITANAEDWRNKLFDTRILGYEQHQPLSTKDIYESIKKKFDSSDTSIDHKLRISYEAIVLIPGNRQDANSDNMAFYKLAKAIKPSLDNIVVLEKAEGFYWEKFIACVLNDICKTINDCDNLTNLCQKLNMTSEDTISYVDSVIDYTKNRFGGNYYKYAEDDYALWLNQNDFFCKLCNINKDDSIDETIKDLCLNNIININYRDKLLRKGLKCEYYIPISSVITSKTILLHINEVISLYVEEERKSLQDKGFAEIVFTLDSLIKKNEEYRLCLPYFDLHHDKLIVGSIGDEKTLSIIGSLVSSPEKMAILTNLTDDQLKDIIENSAEISNLSNKVKTLEDENKGLQARVEALQELDFVLKNCSPDKLDQVKDIINKFSSEQASAGGEETPVGGEDSTDIVIVPKTHEIEEVVDFEGHTHIVRADQVQYAGLSLEEIERYVEEAKGAVVKYFRELDEKYDLGLQFDKEKIARHSYSQLYGISDRHGNMIPIVVHSYKGPQYRYFDLNWYDWQLLSQKGSMLFVLTVTGLQCIPLYALPVRNFNISINNDMSNENRAALLTLAAVGQQYSTLSFDFGNNMPQGFKDPLPFDYVPEQLGKCIMSIKEVCDQNIPQIANMYNYGRNIPLVRSTVGYSLAMEAVNEGNARDIFDAPANETQAPSVGTSFID